MDIIGYTRPGTNIVSIAASGKYSVVIKLKTVDSQFVSTTLNGPDHRAAARVGEGRNTRRRSRTRIRSHRARSPTIARFTTQDYVFSKNAHYWQAGKPLIGCLEYVQATSNDSALALIQSGQVDWTHNFVANVEKETSNPCPTC